MDRASFLRSLNFLRPLPPNVWESSVVTCIGDSNNQNDDEDGAYSGSTITPPTPSRNSNAVLVFNGPHIVVSIESGTSYDLIERRVTTNGKKRGRGDDDDDDDDNDDKDDYKPRPMFFEHHPINNTKEGSTTDQKSDNMDVEPDDIEHKRKETHWNDHNINSDPSLCTFEVAIIKEIITSGTSAPLKNGAVRGSVITTPNKYHQTTTDDYGLDTVESRTLLFRFGNRFVFHVDECAISEILYEPGGNSKGDKSYNYDDRNMDTENGNEKRNASSPPKKRQRHDNVENDSKPNVELKHLPPSVMIRFGSCLFRVFSLEANNDNGSKTIASDQIARPASRIWGTLATNVDTIEDRLMNMRNTLIQQFDIDNRERKQAISFSSWRMAPPGCGHAFHTWQQEMLLEKSSFFSYTPSRFVNEDWSRCLGDEKVDTIDCPSSISSPQKSSSPSKSGSSSTHFEQGQKVESSSQSKKGSAEDSNSGTHLKENNGIQPSESQSSSLKGLEINNEETLLLSSLRKPKNGSSNSQSDSSNDKMDTEDDAANNEQSWQNNIYNKYLLFQTSAVQMELANPVAAPLHHHHSPDVSMKTRLTSCADMLASSYLTVKEFKEQCQQSEDAIVNATTEIDAVLESLFPARGKKMTSIPTTGQQRRSTESTKSIDELLSTRKEAIAAKLALLMIPKR